MSGYPEQTNNLLQTILQHHLGASARVKKAVPTSGGCINAGYKITLNDGQRCFIKLNQQQYASMFAAESAGLQAIRASNTILAPTPLGHGVHGQHAYLIMEFMELQTHGNSRMAGEQLAALHRQLAPHYGWEQDNTIGSTPQHNTWHKDWISFWQQQRLGFQLNLAHGNGYPGKAYQQGLRLQEQLGSFFTDYHPLPSLLHGDLWGGNMAFLADGRPVIFDPAVYYGDRETDLAMTELFGGFSTDFYAAYNSHWPLDNGYGVRKTLYNLYHILNHYNLFGGGYAGQAARMTERLLAET